MIAFSSSISSSSCSLLDSTTGWPFRDLARCSGLGTTALEGGGGMRMEKDHCAACSSAVGTWRHASATLGSMMALSRAPPGAVSHDEVED